MSTEFGHGSGLQVQHSVALGDDRWVVIAEGLATRDFLLRYRALAAIGRERVVSSSGTVARVRFGHRTKADAAQGVQISRWVNQYPIRVAGGCGGENHVTRDLPEFLTALFQRRAAYAGSQSRVRLASKPRQGFAHDSGDDASRVPGHNGHHDLVP